MNQERVVQLTDGTRLRAKVNFATMYYIKQEKLDKKMDYIESLDEVEDEAEIENEQMELAAHMIYVILKSNGRSTITFGEALELVPLDMDELQAILDSFSDSLEEYKKKEMMKKQSPWI